MAHLINRLILILGRLEMAEPAQKETQPISTELLEAIGYV